MKTEASPRMKLQGNKAFSLLVLAIASARLYFMIDSVNIYWAEDRMIMGPPVDVEGVIIYLFPVMAGLFLSYGLWNIENPQAIACIIGASFVTFSYFSISRSLLGFISLIACFYIAYRFTKATRSSLLFSRKISFLRRKRCYNKARIRRVVNAGGTTCFVILSVVSLCMSVHADYPFVMAATPDQVDPVIHYSNITFQERQAIYREQFKGYNDMSSQIVKVFLNMSVDGSRITRDLDEVRNFEDTMDFTLNRLVRLMYLNKGSGVIPADAKAAVDDALINSRYWFTEPGRSTAIYWTENHQILFHTAELLAGQLYPDAIFPNSGMTGREHVAHAEPLILRWLGWKGRFGFNEWQSNVYYELDISALVNLVDFAENASISVQASMVLDIIAFTFANQYFKDRFATTHGRTYDDKMRGTSPLWVAQEDMAEPAWLLAGVGGHHEIRGRGSGGASLATSKKYQPPAIIEEIAKAATLNFEHKERMNIGMYEGKKYGIEYNEENLMFWWMMAAPIGGPVISTSFEVMRKYNLDPGIVCGTGIPEILQAGSVARGMTLGAYSDLLWQISSGVALDEVNMYTYRTPDYQLSGVQDRKKGTTGIQELYWQASCGGQAFVYTCGSGGLGFRPFTGGWKPRTTFFKNVGVIIYDRPAMPVEGELASLLLDAGLNLYYGDRPYNHAYFPRWAFDEVRQSGGWTFGAKDGGYVALYSHEPTYWASDYDIRVVGKKNAWLVELGSASDYGSFDAFVSAISASPITIFPKNLGYSVSYTSPSRGQVSAGWEGPMTVNGTEVDLGPYPRFDNPFCFQEFGTNVTTIVCGNRSLVLDFNTGTRTMVN